MRSLWGSGYGLKIIYSGSSGTLVGPGLLYCYEGTWHVNGSPVLPNTGLELTRPIELLGTGIVAVAQLDDEAPIVGFEEYEITPGVIAAPPVVHDKNWGYEVEVPTFAKKVQLKLLHVLPGHRTSLQYHNFKDEVMMFLDGRRVGGPTHDLAGVHYPRGTVHRVSGPALYFEASTYHPDDVVRLADDYGRAPKSGHENTVMVRP